MHEADALELLVDAEWLAEADLQLVRSTLAGLPRTGELVSAADAPRFDAQFRRAFETLDSICSSISEFARGAQDGSINAMAAVTIYALRMLADRMRVDHAHTVAPHLSGFVRAFGSAFSAKRALYVGLAADPVESDADLERLAGRPGV